jgi:hypothetical protein
MCRQSDIFLQLMMIASLPFFFLRAPLPIAIDTVAMPPRCMNTFSPAIQLPPTHTEKKVLKSENKETNRVISITRDAIAWSDVHIHSYT